MTIKISGVEVQGVTEFKQVGNVPQIRDRRIMSDVALVRYLVEVEGKFYKSLKAVCRSL